MADFQLQKFERNKVLLPPLGFMSHLCKARKMLLAVVCLSAQESLTWPLMCLALSVAKVEAISGISG